MKTRVCFASLFFVALQATDEIYEDTSTIFEKFLRSSEFIPKVVRLNSQGGSLRGGVLLGELFRSHGLATEVGSSNLTNDQPNARLALNLAPSINWRLAVAVSLTFQHVVTVSDNADSSNRPSINLG